MCNNCNQLVEYSFDEEHNCCIQRPEPKTPISKFIFFDIETLKLERTINAPTASATTQPILERLLWPNVVCAQVATILPYNPEKGITVLHKENLSPESYKVFLSKYPEEKDKNAVDKLWNGLW